MERPGTGDSPASKFRRRYIVRYADTLESIALEVLGDRRFAELLLVINRMSVNKSGNRLVIEAGQQIWLPTTHEVDVHRKYFFGSAKSGDPITTTLSRFATLLQKLKQCNRPMETPEPQPPPCIEPTPEPANVQNVRTSNCRPQIFSRRCYKVRPGDTLHTVAVLDPLIKDASMWKLLAHLNGLSLEEDDCGRPAARLAISQFLVLPTEEEIEEYRLLNRLADSAVGSTNVDLRAFESGT